VGPQPAGFVRRRGLRGALLQQELDGERGHVPRGCEGQRIRDPHDRRQARAVRHDPAGAAPFRRFARQVTKPGYGPLSVRTGELSVPAGFTVIGFGAAGTPMSDGLKTPMRHAGTLAVDAGGGRVHLIRNHEGFDPGKALGKKNAYDRVAQGGVTTSLFDTTSGTLLGSSLVLNGTDNNCNGGRTPWGSWLSCEESTVGPAIDPKTGIVYMTEDNGDPGDGFYRYLPNNTTKLQRGGKLEMLAIEGRSTYDTEKGQKVGKTLRCEWVPIKDPDPEHADKHPEAVYMQGRELGRGALLRARGRDVLRRQRLLRGVGGRQQHAYDDEAPKGAIGRSEWSGACYSPDGKWLFVHIQIPGKTYAITGPWEQGWL
jgi:secreted PhoX family phosphatase